MRMRTVLGILIILLNLTVQGQPQKEILNEAYKKSSIKELDKFFKTWNKEIRPISKRELIKLNDTVQNIYNLLISNSDAYHHQVHIFRARCRIPRQVEEREGGTGGSHRCCPRKYYLAFPSRSHY